jgi:drug/metabolite transporter (DMT)-like permease
MHQPASGAGLLLALGSAACYGFNIVFARISALEGVNGPTLIAYRVLMLLVLAAGTAWAMAGTLRVPADERRPLLVMALSGASVGVSYLSSVAFIPVTVAAVIFYTFPVLIVLATPFVDGRRVRLPQLGIAALAFVGVVLVVGTAFSGLDPRGLILATVASVSAVVQFFAGTRCRRAGTLAKVFWLQLIGFPVAVTTAALTGGLGSPAQLAQAPLAVAMTITGFLIGFVLQIMALARITASAAGLAFCLEPVVAALTAALVLGERMEPVQYFGGALVIAAIVGNVLVERRRDLAAVEPLPGDVR